MLAESVYGKRKLQCTRALCWGWGGNLLHYSLSLTQLLNIISTVACQLANCERYYARCEITDTGLATCVCPKVEDCPDVPDEVCGNDTRTYDTECHMRVQACQLKTPLSIVKEGPCGTCYIKDFEYKCTKLLSRMLFSDWLLYPLSILR